MTPSLSPPQSPRGLPPPCRLRLPFSSLIFPQALLINPAVSSLGQGIDKDKLPRHLIISQVLKANFLHLRFGSRLTRLQSDESAGHLPPHLIGNTHRRHLSHLGISRQHRFNIAGIDILPLGDEHI